LFKIFKNRRFWELLVAVSFGILGFINLFKYPNEGYYISGAYFLSSVVFLLVAVLKQKKPKNRKQKIGKRGQL